MPRTVQIVSRALSRLRANPQWGIVLGGISPSELSAFAADLSVRRQQSPVKILPNGMIVDGHIIVAAARLLGWTHVDVEVCQDLADADQYTLEYRMLSEAVNRRQLGDLGKARCIYRMCELDARNTTFEGSWEDAVRESAKEKIAQRLGITLQSANRYLLAVRAILPVQQACERGEITLTDTGRAARLSPPIQRRIASRISRGERAATVVAEYIGPRPDEVSAAVMFARLVRGLGRYVPPLRDRVADISEQQLRNNLVVIQQARRLLQRFEERAAG